ncbi:MAG TPA: hypothetical protein VJO33_18650, partial [Gemmatimonadaceae bacterium]|nr:hypothetical protein [Gemmatimonadaceae bacterium]
MKRTRPDSATSEEAEWDERFSAGPLTPLPKYQWASDVTRTGNTILTRAPLLKGSHRDTEGHSDRYASESIGIGRMSSCTAAARCASARS